jgi:methionyl-tRNA formyltransferase
MNILLFGAKQHGTEIAKILLELGHKLNVVYLIEEPHEEIYYEHLKDFAVSHNINSISHKEIEEKALIALIKKENIDLILLIKWRFIVSEQVIKEAKYGGFVIHDSILPKYRGFAPLNWAIINGEKEVGATFFKLVQEMDAGQIYKNIIRENISRVSKDDKEFLIQNEKEATYCCMRRPEDSKIDWNKSSTEIHNFVRALAPPFPCAYTSYDNKKIEITKTKILSESDRYTGRIPGRILNISNDGIKVLNGSGILIIEEIKKGGKKINASSFFKTIKKGFK